MNFDDVPFAGLLMAVTRPGDAGVALARALETDGASILYVPTIAFERAPDEAALIAMLPRLAEQDHIVFVSPYAVTSAFEYLKSHGFASDWPHVRLYAMGSGTAEALRKEGACQVTMPIESHSESLLMHPFLQAIQGQKVAIVRGEFGRQLLEPQLEARGAAVMSVVTYRRVLPTTVSMDAFMESLKSGAIRVILCSSFDTVNHLWQLMPNAMHEALSQVPCVVMSERVRQLSIRLGCRTVWVTSTADYAALRTFLINKRNELWQRPPKTQ